MLDASFAEFQNPKINSDVMASTCVAKLGANFTSMQFGGENADLVPRTPVSFIDIDAKINALRLFQSYDLTWNSTQPDLTTCFQSSVLVWIPCGFLWLVSLFYALGESFNHLS